MSERKESAMLEDRFKQVSPAVKVRRGFKLRWIKARNKPQQVLGLHVICYRVDSG